MTWKKIKQNSNYSINENGEVRNNTTNRIKKPTLNKANGYLMVTLYKDNNPWKITIHRLLAEAFIPNPENKPCVDHKDGNRQNNSLSNIRWATYSDNNSRFNTFGVRSEKIKVTYFKELRKKRGGGHIEWLEEDKVLFFNRIIDVADYFNVTSGNISLMLKSGKIGRRGKMRGYKFEYCKSNVNV